MAERLIQRIVNVYVPAEPLNALRDVDFGDPGKIHIYKTSFRVIVNQLLEKGYIRDVKDLHAINLVPDEFAGPDEVLKRIKFFTIHWDVIGEEKIITDVFIKRSWVYVDPHEDFGPTG